MNYVQSANSVIVEPSIKEDLDTTLALKDRQIVGIFMVKNMCMNIKMAIMCRL